jgi:hypothetical protein
VLPAGSDGLALTITDTEFVMAARMHNLRTITANVDLGAPSFLIDTASNEIFSMDLNVAGLEVAGTIDHLVPNMRMEVAADETGALSGLRYTADETTNSLSFDIPGFATFSATNPVPTVMQIGMGEVLSIFASEHFTLNLEAEIEGLAASVQNLRVRVMDFGGSIGGTPGEEEEEPDEDAPIPLYFNTTEVSDACPLGCTYTLPSGVLELGPVVVGALSATIVFTPAGFAANDATVLMRLEGTSAVWVGQEGLVHCATGTNLVAETIIDVSLRNGLCDGSSNLADLQTVSLVAPSAVEDGTAVVHSHTLRNAGPSPAAAVRIDATFTDGLGAPTPTCSAGGVVAIDVPAGTASCAWAGNTAVNVLPALTNQRTLTLTWPAAASTIGATVATTFAGTTTSAGTKTSVGGSTTVYDTVGVMEITSVSSTPAVVAGDQNIVHRVDARNDGPSAAPNMRITAVVTGAPQAAAVTCSDDGVVTGNGCTWAGDTPSGGTRWAELIWTVPVGTPAGSVKADYTVTSDLDALADTASATTSIAAEVANIQLLGLTAPERVQPGMTIDHTAQLRNAGPSSALNARLIADYDTALGEPTVVCSGTGTASTFPEIGRTRCTWLGVTPILGEQSMTLSWTTADDLVIPVAFATRFQATSSTDGTRGEGVISTLVAEPVRADLSLVPTGPATWANGGNLVHTAAVTNAGPEPAEDVVITAALPTDVIANPTVTCGAGGVQETVVDQATCTYAGDTAAGATRTMTLTWLAASVVAAPVGTIIDVDFTGTSSTPGASASGSTSTERLPVTADLEFSALNAPPQWATGANLVHSAVMRNIGPAVTGNGVVITAILPGAPVPNPTVTCGTGGTALTVGTTATCTYATSSSAVNATRTMTLTWSTAQITTAGVGAVVGVTWSADSPITSGTNAAGATSTSIVAQLADMTVTGGANPATVLPTGTLAQAVTAQRTGPTGATNMRIIATIDPAFPAPTSFTCSTGATPSSTATTRQCQWPSTTGTTARTLTLNWTAAAVGGASVGDIVTTNFLVNSDTFGAPASAVRITEVVATPPLPVADLAIVGVIAPETLIIGSGSLEHTVEAINNGPAAVNPFIMLSSHDGTLGTPTVTCSTGGTATPSVDGNPVARCQWANTTAGTARTMVLTWAVPEGTSPAAFDVAHDVTSTSVAVTVEPDSLAASTNLVAPE